LHWPIAKWIELTESHGGGTVRGALLLHWPIAKWIKMTRATEEERSACALLHWPIAKWIKMTRATEEERSACALLHWPIAKWIEMTERRSGRVCRRGLWMLGLMACGQIEGDSAPRISFLSSKRSPEAGWH